MSDITERAMLVSIHISVWEARKRDKKATQEVAKTHGIKESAGNYRKALFPEEATTYKKAIAAATAARERFKSQTLPWSENSIRILPATNFMPFSASMREERTKVETANELFFKDYENLKRMAKGPLSSLYSDEDYPSVEALRSKFSFTTSTYPLPDAGDFRVDLSKSIVERIKTQMQEEMEATLTTSSFEVWNRLKQALLSMHEKLSLPAGTPGSIYRDTLFENVESLCELLPRLNLFSDPALDKSIEEVKDKVLRYRPQQCRDLPGHRTAAARNVAKILETMKDF